MAEVAPAGGGGPNRMFLVIALGLVGLLVLGVIAIGGIFLFNQVSRPAIAPTAIRVAITTPTHALPTAPANATDTPAPTGTATLVVQPVAPAGGTTPAAGITATSTVTVTVSAGTPGSQLPGTGLGEDLLLLAAGVVLVLVIFVARRARVSPA